MDEVYCAGFNDGAQFARIVERDQSLSIILEVCPLRMIFLSVSQDVLGYKKCDLVGRNSFRLVSAESVKKVAFKMIYSKLSGRTVQYEVDLKNKNGTLETWRAQLAIRSAKIRIEAYPINDFACSNDGDQRASVRAPEPGHTQTEQFC